MLLSLDRGVLPLPGRLPGLMKTPLERKLRASLRLLGVSSGAQVVVGVSGGADSIALADALSREHDGTLTIAHLNHLLRADESDADAQFVERFARSLNIQSVTECINVAATASATGRNLEAVAREIRYDFLGRVAVAAGAHFVTTAHTRDDQIETIFMRLIRGTGPDGLRGIYPSRPLGEEVSLVRPLLDVSRAEILDHCEQRKLSFRSDSSNADLELMRNRVRAELLPNIRSANPRLDEALLRIAALVAEDDDKLTEDAQAVFERALDSDDSLKLGALRGSHVAIRRRVLRLWLRNARGHLQRIDGVHLAAVEKLMLEGENGKRVELPGGLAVVKQHQSLVIAAPNAIERE